MPQLSLGTLIGIILLVFCLIFAILVSICCIRKILFKSNSKVVSIPGINIVNIGTTQNNISILVDNNVNTNVSTSNYNTTQKTVQIF
jgi:hypothetical protein